MTLEEYIYGTKRKEKITTNLEFYIQQKCPVKMKSK